MKSRHVFATLSAVVMVSFALLGVAPAQVGAATQVLGDWQMNEARGSTRLVDSSGNGYHGTIGTDVVLGVRSGGATVHSFPYISSTAPADPEGRLHIVNQRDALDPGTADYAVELRFRNTHIHGNITQKGQSGASGGYWKVEIDDGVLSCVFSGTSASVALKSTVRVTDDVWRTVRCERLRNESVMYLDGQRVARARVWTGSIANTWTLSIGGKSNCSSVDVQCDYFRGDLDYLRIERPDGGSTPTTTTTTTSTTTTVRPSTTTTTVRPTTTTTTVRPTTTTSTTTTTVKPATQLPVGRLDRVDVDGSTIRVSGPVSDPDGPPPVLITDVMGSRYVMLQRQSSGGRYTASWTTFAPGTHTVCAYALDVPTGSPVPIGCGEAVVK